MFFLIKFSQRYCQVMKKKLLPFLNIKYIEKNLGRGKCYKLFYFKVVLNHLKCERESVTKQDSSYAYY